MRRSMVMTVAAASLCAGAVACTSSVEGSGSLGAVDSGKPVSGASPQQILAAAGAVVGAVNSVHVTGVDYDNGTKYTVDLNVGGDKTCKGTVKIGDSEPTPLVILNGDLFYYLDKDKSYHDGDEDAEASEQAISMCSRDALHALVKPSSEVSKQGTGTVDGEKAVTLKNSGAVVSIRDDSGAPYVLEFQTPQEDKTDLHFSDWNKPVKVTKPEKIACEDGTKKKDCKS